MLWDSCQHRTNDMKKGRGQKLWTLCKWEQYVHGGSTVIYQKKTDNEKIMQWRDRKFSLYLLRINVCEGGDHHVLWIRLLYDLCPKDYRWKQILKMLLGVRSCKLLKKVIVYTVFPNIALTCPQRWAKRGDVAWFVHVQLCLLRHTNRSKQCICWGLLSAMD